jgi:hypothetical protein
MSSVQHLRSDVSKIMDESAITQLFQYVSTINSSVPIDPFKNKADRSINKE